MWSVIQKYVMLMCLVLCPLDSCPFSSSLMALWLSWNSKVLVSYPCSKRKCLVHRAYGSTSAVATSLASVELLVLSFCFCNVPYMAPLLRAMIPPVWLFMLVCTLYELSVHHFVTLVLSALRVRTRSIVSRRYLMILKSLLRLSLLGAFTLVHRYATAV